VRPQRLLVTRIRAHPPTGRELSGPFPGPRNTTTRERSSRNRGPSESLSRSRNEGTKKSEKDRESEKLGNQGSRKLVVLLQGAPCSGQDGKATEAVKWSSNSGSDRSYSRARASSSTSALVPLKCASELPYATRRGAARGARVM